jgi:peptidoglycan/LPS O-acetylase OafA/YrhL
LSNDSHFYSFQTFSAYGYLGVDLFFMISGVVICASAVSKNATDFLRSRFIRLFPTFIIAASIAMLIGRFSQYSYNRIGFLDYLPNLLLITQATGSKLADGVYWTLFFEIRFYLLVALCLFIWGKKLNFFYFVNLWLFAVVILNSVSNTPRPVRLSSSFSYARLFSRFHSRNLRLFGNIDNPASQIYFAFMSVTFSCNFKSNFSRARGK